MLGSRQELAYLQSDFFREKYRKLMRWLLYTILINFLLISGVIYIILTRPDPNYYANTTDGRILQMPSAIH